MRGQRAGTRSRIGYDILGYLAENPGAQDTVKGIVEWWLLEQKIKRKTAQVEDVLGDLVVDGLVLEVPGTDLQMHYRINPAKYQAIRALLDKGRRQ